MEFWVGCLFAVVFAIGILITSLLIRRSKKWIIGTVLCSMLTFVFALYCLLTILLVSSVD